MYQYLLIFGLFLNQPLGDKFFLKTRVERVSAEKKYTAISQHTERISFVYLLAFRTKVNGTLRTTIFAWFGSPLDLGLHNTAHVCTTDIRLIDIQKTIPTANRTATFRRNTDL